MASLVQRRGRYYAQFFDTNRHPKRKRISLRTKKKDVARRLLSTWQEDYERGKFDPWIDDAWTYDEEPLQALTLGDAIDRFIRAKKSTGRSENTIRTYREILRLLRKAVGPTKRVASLAPSPLKDLVWDPELADATKYKRYGHLRTFFRWWEGQNLWRIPLFWFAFYTGMRGGELARLRWKDIDFERRLIYIREQKNQKEQTIPLNQKAREVLRGLDPDDPDRDAFVFTSPGFEGDDRSARNFRERAAETFRKAREVTKKEDDLVDVPEHLSFHSLRHGFCTALAAAGKSAAVIKEAARHADIQTSMRYVHMANETLKSEVEDAFE